MFWGKNIKMKWKICLVKTQLSKELDTWFCLCAGPLGWLFSGWSLLGMIVTEKAVPCKNSHQNVAIGTVMYQSSYRFFNASYKHNSMPLLVQRGASNIWEDGKRKERWGERSCSALLHALNAERHIILVRKAVVLEVRDCPTGRAHTDVMFGYCRAIKL